MSRRLAAFSLSAALALAGCTTVPPVRSPAPIGEARDPMPFRVAVAPLSVTLADDERPKEYEARDVVDHDALRAELVAWIEASDLFAGLRSAQGSSEQFVRDEAWKEGDHLLLEIGLREFRSTFEGHNGWWIPNILNWLFWIVPAWFVATEEYSLTFEADVVVRSVDSLRVLYQEVVPVRVEGTLDELDRGIQLFGWIWPNNDEDSWRLIIEKLLPGARSELGAGVAAALGGGLRDRIGGGETLEKMRKTLALVVGVSNYRDPVTYPPLGYAAEDARSVVRALTDAEQGSGLQDRHTYRLIESEATREALAATVQTIAGRTTPGDQLVVYFSGYGTRTPEGPTLLLHEAGPDGTGQITLSALAEMLGTVPGEKLLVLDCGFDGRGRSIESKLAAPAQAGDDLRPLVEAGVGVVLACSPSSEHLAPEHLQAGLFSHHVVRGLRGIADRDEDGRVTGAELFRLASERTEAESALLGRPQHPIAGGLERPFALFVGSVDQK